MLTQAHSALTATSRCPLAGQAIPIPLLFDPSLSPPLVPPLKIPQYLSCHPKRFFPASHSEPHSPRVTCGMLQRACSPTHLCHGTEGSPEMPLGAEGAGVTQLPPPALVPLWSPVWLETTLSPHKVPLLFQLEHPFASAYTKQLNQMQPTSDFFLETLVNAFNRYI